MHCRQVLPLRHAPCSPLVVPKLVTLTLVLPPASLRSSEPSSCCCWTMDLRHSLWLSKAGLVVSSIQFNRELHQDLGSKGRKRPRRRYPRRRQQGGDLHTEENRLSPAAAYRCEAFHAQNSDEGTSGCLRNLKVTLGHFPMSEVVSRPQ